MRGKDASQTINSSALVKIVAKLDGRQARGFARPYRDVLPACPAISLQVPLSFFQLRPCPSGKMQTAAAAPQSVWPAFEILLPVIRGARKLVAVVATRACGHSFTEKEARGATLLANPLE